MTGGYYIGGPSYTLQTIANSDIKTPTISNKSIKGAQVLHVFIKTIIGLPANLPPDVEEK